MLNLFFLFNFLNSYNMPSRIDFWMVDDVFLENIFHITDDDRSRKFISGIQKLSQILGNQGEYCLFLSCI